MARELAPAGPVRRFGRSSPKKRPHTQTSIDGNGSPVGQRPGFLVCDDVADDQAREAAYREYAATVSERWRQGPGQRSSPARSEPPQTFGNPEAARIAAYAQYNRDIQERWRK